MKFPKFKILLVIALLVSVALIPSTFSQVIDDIEDEDDTIIVNNKEVKSPASEATIPSPDAVTSQSANDVTANQAEAAKPKKRVYSFDDDEFEGLSELKKAKKANKPSKESLKKVLDEAAKKTQDKPKMSTFEVLTQAFRNKSIWDFKMELGFIGFVLVYVLMVFVGKTQNQNYVVRFVNAAADFLTYNFAVIGSSTALKAGTCGEKVSLHEFNLPLTGRKNMKAACLHFILRPRQDILTNAIYALFGWKDHLTIECILPETSPFCLCVSKKSAFRDISEASYDIKNFTQKQRSYPGLGPDFVVAYDSPEVARLVDKLSPAIAALKEHFISLHITDQPTIFQSHPNALKMDFVLPGDVEANKKAVVDLLELFVNAVDGAVELRLSGSESSKNAQVRLNYKKKEQAEEAKEEGAEEKELTPEQIKRQEQRKMRRKMNRVVKVKFQ